MKLHARHFAAALIFLLGTCWYAVSYTYSSGPPAGNTNAPGESNCTSCHSGTLNSGGNLSSLTLSTDMPNGKFLPDSTYTITVSYAETGVSKFGFQATALSATTNNMMGTLTVTNSSSTKKVSNATREYIEHTSSGTFGSGSVSWSFEWKAPSVISSDVKFYVALNASNSSGTNSGDDIYAKNWNFSLDSSYFPVATITASEDTICTGESVSFNGNATNTPLSWQWNFIGANIGASGSRNPSATYQTAGTYMATLRARNSLGWGEKDTFYITVKEGTTASIFNNDTTLCWGDSVTLTAAMADNYLWSNNETTQAITISASDTLTVTTWNSAGCTATSDPVIVQVQPKPQVLLFAQPGGASFCELDTLTFTASAGFESYDFYRNDQNIISDTQNVFVNSGNGQSRYVVVATDDLGCMSDSSNAVTVNFEAPAPAPIVRCDSVGTSIIRVAWDSIPDALGYEVSLDGQNWMPPSTGNFGLMHQEENLQSNTQYTFWVRAFMPQPCEKSEIAMVTCETDSCNFVDVRVASPAEACFGDTLDIVIAPQNLSAYSIRFENTTFSDTIFQLLPSVGSHTLSFFITDSANLVCPPKRVDVPLFVNWLPNFNILTDFPSGLCMGDTATFKVDETDYTNYVFMLNGTDTLQQGTNTSYSTAMLADGDVVSVQVEDTNGCMAEEAALPVLVNELPVVSFTSQIVSGRMVQFTDQSATATSWDWDFGDGNSSLDQNPQHEYQADGTYQVMLAVEDGNGCTNAHQEEVQVITTGIAAVPVFAEVVVSPNPFTDRLQVQWQQAKAGAAILMLVNAQGQVVLQEQLQAPAGEMQAWLSPRKPLPAGLYLLRLQVQDAVFTIPVLKR